MHTLYKLTFKSGKSYIGQTVRKMQTRFAQHRASANRGSMLPVHCAWRAHGEPDLQVIGLYGTHEELHQAEIEAIASHSTLSPNGYNLGHGGETAPSKNSEVAKKISERAKGRKHEDTQTWSNAMKARWEDEESRARMLEGMRSCWTDEMRKAAGDRARARWERRKSEGWTMPEAQKEKLRQKVVSEETKQKMSAAAKGKKKAPRSEETRAKLSASSKKMWQDPEKRHAHGNAISSALKEKHANMTEEERVVFSNIRKRAWETRRLNKLKSIQEE